ncbi:hypothetical protein CsSME_00039173 [Camellia sinensis var. sinensis]
MSIQLQIKDLSTNHILHLTEWLLTMKSTMQSVSLFSTCYVSKLKMMTNKWVTTALIDDSVVVKLVFRLKHSLESLEMLRWCQCQPRLKLALASAKKEDESTRCSPTMYLS